MSQLTSTQISITFMYVVRINILWIFHSLDNRIGWELSVQLLSIFVSTESLISGGFFSDCTWTIVILIIGGRLFQVFSCFRLLRRHLQHILSSDSMTRLSTDTFEKKLSHSPKATAVRLQLISNYKCAKIF